MAGNLTRLLPFTCGLVLQTSEIPSLNSDSMHFCTALNLLCVLRPGDQLNFLSPSANPFQAPYSQHYRRLDSTPPLCVDGIPNNVIQNFSNRK